MSNFEHLKLREPLGLKETELMYWHDGADDQFAAVLPVLTVLAKALKAIAEVRGGPDWEESPYVAIAKMRGLADDALALAEGKRI